MKRILVIAALAAASALSSGCITSGYYHTHPCVCPDGQVRTVRHWHARTGYAGYHTHPFPNDVHRTLMISGGMKEIRKGFAEDED